MINLNLSALVKFVEGLVAPFEKLAAYFAVGGVGVADYPHLPASVRVGALLAGVYHIVNAPKATTPPA